jgi:hypothetical protein
MTGLTLCDLFGVPVSDVDGAAQRLEDQGVFASADSGFPGRIFPTPLTRVHVS